MLITLLTLLTLLLLHAAAMSAGHSNGEIEQMNSAMERGDFKAAIAIGVPLEKAFALSGRTIEQAVVLGRLSAAYQSLGYHRKAMEILRKAANLTPEVDRTAVKARLANAHLYVNEFDQAASLLDEAVAEARKKGDSPLLAAILNYQGNLFALREDYSAAKKAFSEALRLSESSGQALLHARIAANMARVLMQAADPASSDFALISFREHKNLPDSHDKAFGLVNTGQIHQAISRTLPQGAGEALSRAEQALREALSTAQRIQDHLTTSYAIGYLALLQENVGQQEKALQSARTAVTEAQKAEAPESLYQWYWLIARIEKQKGNMQEALTAYRRAVKTLQSIRHELLADCRMYNQVSFYDIVEPMYSGLVEVLLSVTDATQDEKAVKTYLAEARETIEHLKTAELQDYFQNACVVSGKSLLKRLEDPVPGTAMVYYVPLQDRLEILAAYPSGTRKVTVAVTKSRLMSVVREFRQKLEKRTTREYLAHGRQLYEWLILPIEKTLSAESVQTLVFVPDGPLRTIPLAALHDGEQFLMRRFRIVNTPAISLTDIQRSSGAPRVLIAGITEAVQGFPPLPHVPAEIDAIEALFSSPALRNSAFTAAELEKALEEKPFSIVHIASHGEISKSMDKTFILTWDHKISMNSLEDFLRISKYRRMPIELLTLSACQTAAGDDRAALGLAGISIKAGARSSLASLWYINDQASSELVTEFYRQLKGGLVDKAEALQRAQIRLADDPRFQHPGYWAPFLLIGNWM